MKIASVFLFLLVLLSCCSKKAMRNIQTETDSVDVVVPAPTTPPPPDPVTSNPKIVKNKHVIENTEEKSVVDPVIKPEPNVIPKTNTKSDPKTKVKSLVKKDNDYNFGKLAYDIPDTMMLKKTYTILLRINRDTNDVSISTGLGPKVKVTNVKTSDEMEVEIVDPTSNSFLIVKNNSDVQLIDTTDYTEWVYNVTPNKSGKLKLNIIVSIIREKGKKQIVYFDNVYVKSNPVIVVKTFWEKYWQWCFSTLIIPFFIWLWNKKKKKKKS